MLVLAGELSVYMEGMACFFYRVSVETETFCLAVDFVYYTQENTFL